MRILRGIKDGFDRVNVEHPSLTALIVFGITVGGLILICVEHPVVGAPMVGVGMIAIVEMLDQAEAMSPKA